MTVPTHADLCHPHSAGAITIFLEVRAPTEEHKALVHKYASFMHSFIGRGVCEYGRATCD